MIAVDTSALMAILLREPGHEPLVEALAAEPETLISAGTLAEALIVAGCRGVLTEMADLVDKLDLRIVEVTGAGARRVEAAYSRWGKGVHRAGLNFGDCFAYAVANEHGCPLLYVGEDFARSDLTSAARPGGR